MLDLAQGTETLRRNVGLSEIELLDQELVDYFGDKLRFEMALSRSLVSFQSSKTKAKFRWYKFKEAFSASLVEYLLDRYDIRDGTILDPFAGSGTALFVASARGITAEGIELLPIGHEIIETRRTLEAEFTQEDFATLRRWSSNLHWKHSEARVPLNELRITAGAYPQHTRDSIERYLGACQGENERVQRVLQFALLCILESVGYTRKDGQYLRWDYRSGRRRGKKRFKKGTILDFDQAICDKIDEILHDMQAQERQPRLFSTSNRAAEITLHRGSCLDILPSLPAKNYDAIITSPPYCNRYDYTRTYALELAMLGSGEREIANLRQQMLICTVENRAKDLLQMNPQWADAIAAADGQHLLQSILGYLENQKAIGNLNNNGIPRMVRGYFYEMACVIAECARVLKPNAPLFMVNDNVRYAGASISVDTILSNLAERLGFRVESILILPNGKGNSSQQMGRHGRDPLRKCVYVWRKA